VSISCVILLSLSYNNIISVFFLFRGGVCMDLIIDKNDLKNIDKNIKYIFELQKDNYNEIKINNKDLTLATKSLKNLLDKKKISQNQYKILSRTIISNYIYNEFEEKLDKYLMKTIYKMFRGD